MIYNFWKRLVYWQTVTPQKSLILQRPSKWRYIDGRSSDFTDLPPSVSTRSHYNRRPNVSRFEWWEEEAQTWAYWHLLLHSKIACGVYDESWYPQLEQLWRLYRNGMNFASNPAPGKTPKFVDLWISTINTAEKINSVFDPVTRAEGLTDHSDWILSRHRITEVTSDIVIEATSYSYFIKNSEFETRNVFERENIQLTW